MENLTIKWFEMKSFQIKKFNGFWKFEFEFLSFFTYLLVQIMISSIRVWTAVNIVITNWVLIHKKPKKIFCSVEQKI